MSKNTIFRFLLIALSGLGVLAGGQLTFTHLQHGETCPMLGPIPACIIVFGGYLSVLLSAFIVKKTPAKLLFFLGWLPVFLLASIGVVLEMYQGDTCPDGAGGIPQCFYSLAMALACLVLFRKIIFGRARQEQIYK